MDLYKAIRDLYTEKEKLERVIASLEELQRTASAVPLMPHGMKRRGRKSPVLARRNGTIALDGSFSGALKFLHSSIAFSNQGLPNAAFRVRGGD